ncbi:hypothetical protein Tco_0672948 [Tanacetum coccineum]
MILVYYLDDKMLLKPPDMRSVVNSSKLTLLQSILRILSSDLKVRNPDSSNPNDNLLDLLRDDNTSGRGTADAGGGVVVATMVLMMAKVMLVQGQYQTE